MNWVRSDDSEWRNRKIHEEWNVAYLKHNSNNAHKYWYPRTGSRIGFEPRERERVCVCVRERFPITYSSVHGEIMKAIMVFIKLQPLHSVNEYLYIRDTLIKLFANPVHLTHNRYNFHNSLVIYPKRSRDGTNETYKSPALTHTNATVPISTPSRRLKCPVNKILASWHTQDVVSAPLTQNTFYTY